MNANLVFFIVCLAIAVAEAYSRDDYEEDDERENLLQLARKALVAARRAKHAANAVVNAIKEHSRAVVEDEDDEISGRQAFPGAAPPGGVGSPPGGYGGPPGGYGGGGHYGGSSGAGGIGGIPNPLAFLQVLPIPGGR